MSKETYKTKALWIKTRKLLDFQTRLHFPTIAVKKHASLNSRQLMGPVLQASSAKLVYDTLMKTAADHRRHLVQDLRNGALAALG